MIGTRFTKVTGTDITLIIAVVLMMMASGFVVISLALNRFMIQPESFVTLGITIFCFGCTFCIFHINSKNMEDLRQDIRNISKNQNKILKLLNQPKKI